MLAYENLREYQKHDVDFITSLPAAALFNQQRTGKTPTALAALEKKNIKKILIVCPASALYQWRDEFEKWLNRPCLVSTGTPKRREKTYAAWTDGLLVSYDTLRIPEDLSLIREAAPGAIVLDEAHRIRNPKTATTSAIFALTDVPYRLALTGTPTPNHTHEIWSILHFLYPHTFPYYWPFINAYFHVSRQRDQNDRVYMDIGRPTIEGNAVINSILNRIATNRKRKEVMPWLPEKDYISIRLPMTSEQTRYLTELEETFETEHIVTIGVLDRLIRYRQICLDPRLLDLKGTSPKTEWLQQYRKDYPERATLVFSKFTKYINRLAEVFPTAGVITGATPVKRRQQICQAFQTGQLNMLLLNVDAAKEALTLDRAEAAVFTDKFPPVGDISQAEDRFVATSKKNADKLHIIYDLVMQGSYEEDIHTMIAARFSETDIINNFKHHLERRNTK